MTRYMVCDRCGNRIDDSWKWRKITFAQYGQMDLCDVCENTVHLFCLEKPTGVKT